MSNYMKASNAWCDIPSGEQRLRCGLEFASYIVAMPYAVNIAAIILDFLKDCDNIYMILSCAMNVNELQSDGMEAQCSYQTRFFQNCFRRAFCSRSIPFLPSLQGACAPAASFGHCLLGLYPLLLGVGGQLEGSLLDAQKHFRSLYLNSH
jgi:hypothetical protein